ncbi:MAG: radical SAM protein [archaeon]
MRVLLVYEAPAKGLYLNELQPLGILYNAAVLESRGIKTDVIDYTVCGRKNIDYKLYDLIGFSMNSSNVERTMKAINQAKTISRIITVAVGGPHARLVPELLLKDPNVDYVIVGEAEDLIANLIEKKDKKEVKGICYKENGKIIRTKPSLPYSNLDDLPFPAIEKVPYKKYNMTIKKKSPVCAINTSRGCPHGCIFCHHSLGHKYRARSPENVVREIIHLKRLGVNELWVADDSFTEDMERAEQICDLIIKNKIDISISLANGIRADKINHRLLSKLKDAGVWLIAFSPEVGLDASLAQIKKGFLLKDVEKAIYDCKALGIRTQTSFIMGFPWETHDSLDLTEKYALELDADFLCLNRLHPYPGTPLWDMICDAQISLKDEKKGFEDRRYYHTKLSEKDILVYIRRLNRKFYNPVKTFKIINLIGLKSTLRMMKYALSSSSLY